MQMAYNWRLTTAACLAALFLSPAFTVEVSAQNEIREKRAQTGFKFLSVSTHPRAAALSNAMTAVEGGAWTMFYNPAAMANQQQNVTAMFGITQWIAGIDYNAAAVSFRPFSGRLGVFGFTLRAVDYGTIQGTVISDNNQGFIDTGLIEPTALSVGFGYAKALTDRFSIGGRVKYAMQDLGSTPLAVDKDTREFTTYSDDNLGVMAFDFGMMYKTGFRSLSFAVAASNFSQEIEYVEESFQLPLTLRIGLAMDVTDLMPGLSSVHGLLLAVEAENPRDFAEHLNFGLEYSFFETLYLRAGYSAPMDEQGLSLGAGLAQELAGFSLSADYAFTDFGVFSDVHRVAFQVGF